MRDSVPHERGLGSPRRGKLALLVAAGFLAIAVTAPASYRLGQSSAIRQWRQAVQPAANRAVAVEPRIVEETTEDAGIRDAALAAVSEPPAGSDLIARWIEPLRGADPLGRFDRGTDSMLAAFHGASVSRDDADRDWIDSPFASTLEKYRDFSVASGDGSQLVLPLTASDLQGIAQNLETAR